VKFTPLALPGAYLIEPAPVTDVRGFFARTFCRREFTANGLNPDLVQSSISFNPHRGTLRGMHYQREPYGEAKVVRCTMGRIYDVTIDLRPESATFRQWASMELSADNRRSVYIPEGCAHGFLTLVDHCEVHYQMSEFFHSESVAGVRWNDPAFSIQWPGNVSIISSRDRDLPDFTA